MQRFETQTDLPLWRLEVLGDNTVIFAFHHAIADGMSSIAFHIHLVKALRTDSSPVPSLVIQIPTSARMTDAVESMTNVRPSVSTITHELLKLVVPPSKKLWTGGDIPSVADLSTTRVRLVSIPPVLAKQLLDACRVNRTTATGAIYALLSCITARLLDKSTQREHNKLEGLIAVSMHPLTGVGDYDICDHPSSFHTVGPLTTEFSWTNAVKVTDECRVYKTKAREQIGMLKFLFGRLDSHFKDHLGKKRECGIVLSNLGRWTAPKAEGPWSIGKPWFTHGDMVIGGFFSASIVGDPSGAMNIAFNWRETIVETEWMDKLVSLFLEELARISTK
uniref:Uncharacterized protein n=1 Tax=Mycena chlorophos TaxID=658473 RepID=A0ABQ0LEB8_MYCCL|nr:predicted protein [Mycena chlorophos]